VKGGTVLERLIAYYGIALLAFATLFAFSTAFDSRIGFGSFLWVGGFLPLVWLIGALRQMGAWREGRRASRVLDPIRSRVGRRALPQLAWVAGGLLTGVVLYGLLLRTRTIDQGLELGEEGLSGGVSLVLLYGTFFFTIGLFVLMTWASDRRDRVAKEAVGEGVVRVFTPDEKAVRIGNELPTGIRKTARALQIAGLAGLWLAVIFFVIPMAVPTALFLVATLPTFVWIGYVYVVVRPRVREIERDLTKRADSPS
jgi:hypothetical protein